jgi:hypothetical protein
VASSAERLKIADIKLSEQFGGYEDPADYKETREPTYCDKGDHKQRSIYHQPQHLDHFKKLEKKH